MSVEICKNLLKDASPEIREKVFQAQGAMKAFIESGIYPIGNYVICRKGLEESDAWEAGGGEYGYDYFRAVQKNTDPQKNNNIDYTRLWVINTDRVNVFTTTHGKQKWYLALSTATKNLFTSEGI